MHPHYPLPHIRETPISHPGFPRYAVSENCATRGWPIHNLIKHFVPEGKGRWTCVEYAELDTPVGRIQVTPGTSFTRGTKFMNLDVAAMLDEQAAKDERRS